jgi:hypothetical protein
LSHCYWSKLPLEILVDKLLRGEVNTSSTNSSLPLKVHSQADCGNLWLGVHLIEREWERQMHVVRIFQCVCFYFPWNEVD